MDILGINQLVTDDPAAAELIGQTNNNWDLNAIVRNGMTTGGRSSTASTEPTTIDPSVTASIDNETSYDAQTQKKSCPPAYGIHGFEIHGQPVIPNDEELYRFLNYFPLASPSPTHLIADELCQQQFRLSRQLSLQKQQLQLVQHQQQPALQTPTRKSLKKKRSGGAIGGSNNKICRRVLGEDLQTLDKWAWRKYGQKPIKGTPYQRSYYKCSTKNNCTAKKLVERIQTEPDTFIVSYYGEHFHQPPAHRNALAGLTRGSSIINSMATASGFGNKPPATTCDDRQPSSCLQATPISPAAPPGNLAAGTADEMSGEIIHVPTTSTTQRRGSSEKLRGDEVDVERELTLLIPNPMAMVGEEMMFGGINQYEERIGNGSSSEWRW